GSTAARAGRGGGGRRGPPAPPPPPLWPELAAKSLGILGFGHIGEALARRARAFDMKVCAIRQRAQAEIPEGMSFIGGPEQLDDGLRQSDFVAITLSLSPQTPGLLGGRRLAPCTPPPVSSTSLRPP